MSHTTALWVIADDGTIEARFAGLIGHISHASEANCRLIAAAPDLLAALRLALKALENARLEYDYHGNPMDKCDADVIAAVDTLRAAIAKATGETA
jgi:hypothetical protein